MELFTLNRAPSIPDFLLRRIHFFHTHIYAREMNLNAEIFSDHAYPIIYLPYLRPVRERNLSAGTNPCIDIIHASIVEKSTSVQHHPPSTPDRQRRRRRRRR